MCYIFLPFTVCPGTCDKASHYTVLYQKHTYTILRGTKQVAQLDQNHSLSSRHTFSSLFLDSTTHCPPPLFSKVHLTSKWNLVLGNGFLCFKWSISGRVRLGYIKCTCESTGPLKWEHNYLQAFILTTTLPSCCNNQNCNLHHGTEWGSWRNSKQCWLSQTVTMFMPLYDLRVVTSKHCRWWDSFIGSCWLWTTVPWILSKQGRYCVLVNTSCCMFINITSQTQEEV